MKAILTKYKPDDDWDEAWNNASFLKEPLIKAVDQLVKEIDEVKDDDFDVPNHYAKLAYRAGQIKMARLIKDILCS